jgi:hypothetical protein
MPGVNYISKVLSQFHAKCYFYFLYLSNFFRGYFFTFTRVYKI